MIPDQNLFEMSRFWVSLLGFSLQNETLILDDLFYLYYCKRGTTLIFVWILFGSEGSIEKDRKGHKYLFLQAKLIWNKFLSGTKLTFELRRSRSNGFQVKVPQGQIIRFLRGGDWGKSLFFFFSFFFFRCWLGGVGEGGEGDRKWVRMLVSYLSGVKIRDLVPFTMSQTLVDHQRPSWYVLGCLSLNRNTWNKHH